jgi:small GTP-binding protein
MEYNTLMLGLDECGKSALVSRFMDTEVFLKTYHETLVDLYHQIMFMMDFKGARNRKVTLNIKDCGHRIARPALYDESDSFIVCFDVANKQSFEKAEQLLRDLQEDSFLSPSSRYQVIMVGCKNDQESRAVSYLQAERMCKSFDIPYIECSALSNYNVEEVFDLVLTQIFKFEKRQRDQRLATRSILKQDAEIQSQ